MRSVPTRGVVAVVAIATIALIVVAVSGAVPPLFADDSPDRPDEPTTEDTLGYVEGYWHDDELAVDDRDTAVVEGDELEAVVYRSMARVEELRGLTFEEEVEVEVISREEFRDDHGDAFVNLTEEQERGQNVTYEALFMVDSESDATAELESIYGGSVEGYYEPSTDRIVIVSDTPDRLELDEIILGHELTHALQDQRFDLSNYERATIDQEAAENGLIEGDAGAVEAEYRQRCGEAWDCPPRADSPASSPSNWGIYLTVYQPYSDGPAYVEHLRERGGWDAVDDAYEDPPESSSTVIHQEERDPVDVDVPDRSSDSWRPLEVDGEPATETVGEAAMVAMFADGAFESGRESVLDADALLGDDPTSYDYDQPHTDGWAGDELVPYVSSDAEANATAPATGYVWETEWRSTEDASEFADGYLELLEIHGAEPVEDRRDTYVIDDEGYPGAYSLERDGETVTIVRAPSVDDLEGIAPGAAPEGEDEIERADVTDADDGGESADDSLPGFAAPGAGAAVVIALLAARARARTGVGSDRDRDSDSEHNFDWDRDSDSDHDRERRSEPTTPPAPPTAESPRSEPSGPAAGVDGTDAAAPDRGRL